MLLKRIRPKVYRVMMGTFVFIVGFCVRRKDGHPMLQLQMNYESEVVS